MQAKQVGRNRKRTSWLPRRKRRCLDLFSAVIVILASLIALTIQILIFALFIIPMAQNTFYGRGEAHAVADDAYVYDAAPVQSNAATLTQAIVRRIIDGDTIDVQMPNGEIERIRLIGIDAPEMGRFGSEEDAEPGAIEARDFVEDLIPPGTTVWLEAQGNDRDRWDRLRRYVWIDVPADLQDAQQRQQLTVNRMLLTHGHAVVWP